MSKETEPCPGVPLVRATLEQDNHCPSCTSATERIAELEQKATENEKVFLEANATCGDLRIKLTSMRTLAEQLAYQLGDWSHEHFGPNCGVCAALASAKEKGVWPEEVLDGG